MDRGELEALHQRLLQLARLREPERVGATATELLDTLRKLSEDVSAARDAAVCELYDAGHSLHEIARRIGVTRGRVFQIIQRKRGVGRMPGLPMS
jgi:DNA-directed RNA polymerase specialized sigma24 family protein